MVTLLPVQFLVCVNVNIHFCVCFKVASADTLGEGDTYRHNDEVIKGWSTRIPVARNDQLKGHVHQPQRDQGVSTQNSCGTANQACVRLFQIQPRGVARQRVQLFLT